MMKENNVIILNELEKLNKKNRRNNKKKAVKLRDRSLTRFEVINLFEDVLDSDEREALSTIIKILGIYMLLETNQLFQIYERMTKQNLKLKYIKKSVKYNLIGEYQYESSVDGEKDLFFYSTKLSGRIYLNHIRFRDNELLLDADINLRQRILTLNEFLIHKRYIMYNNHILNHFKGLYEVKDSNKNKLICYFNQLSTEQEAIVFMVNYLNRFKHPDEPLITEAEVLQRYRFESVEIVGELYYFGNLTIGTPHTYIYDEEIEKGIEY